MSLGQKPVACLSEMFQVPCMIFTGVMAWKVGRGDVCNCFWIDSYNLRQSGLRAIENGRMVANLSPVRLIGRYRLCCHNRRGLMNLHDF